MEETCLIWSQPSPLPRYVLWVCQQHPCLLRQYSAVFPAGISAAAVIVRGYTWNIHIICWWEAIRGICTRFMLLGHMYPLTYKIILLAYKMISTCLTPPTGLTYSSAFWIGGGYGGGVGGFGKASMPGRWETLGKIRIFMKQKKLRQASMPGDMVYKMRIDSDSDKSWPISLTIYDIVFREREIKKGCIWPKPSTPLRL